MLLKSARGRASGPLLPQQRSRGSKKERKQKPWMTMTVGKLHALVLEYWVLSTTLQLHTTQFTFERDWCSKYTCRCDYCWLSEFWICQVLLLEEREDPCYSVRYAMYQRSSGGVVRIMMPQNCWWLLWFVLYNSRIVHAWQFSLFCLILIFIQVRRGRITNGYTCSKRFSSSNPEEDREA